MLPRLVGLAVLGTRAPVQLEHQCLGHRWQPEVTMHRKEGRIRLRQWVKHGQATGLASGGRRKADLRFAAGPAALLCRLRTAAAQPALLPTVATPSASTAPCCGPLQILQIWKSDGHSRPPRLQSGDSLLQTSIASSQFACFR